VGAPLPTGQVSLRPASPCPGSTARPDPPDRGGAAGFARWGGIQPRLRIIRARLADTETQMCAVLEELGLAELVTTIAELTMTGAAA
jgi:hypothetical protein